MAHEQDLNLTRDIIVALLQGQGARGHFRDNVGEIAAAIPVLYKAFQTAAAPAVPRA